MTLNIIVAHGTNREIGAENRLLWHLPTDMKHFRDTTKGHVVVMGRKTWESMGSKPLKDRANIVLSRTAKVNDLVPGENTMYLTMERFKDLYEQIKDFKQVFIIGGEQIYREFANLADVLYITEVEQSFPEADTFFPEVHGAFTKTVLKDVYENGLYYKILKYERV